MCVVLNGDGIEFIIRYKDGHTAQIRISPWDLRRGDHVAGMPDHRFGRIALPAAVSYIERKSNAIREAAGRELAAYWGTK